MKIVDHIFREYDIRGMVGSDLTDEFAYLLGRGFALMARERGAKTAAIGYDARLSSPGYADNLARGMADEGLDVTITGLGPTPQLYYAIFELHFDCGIQVTGSHNPPDMNGYKLCIGKGTLAGAEIQEVKRRILALPPKPSAAKGKISALDIREKYTNTLIENSRGHLGKRKLKVVVDAGNGVGGLVGPKVLRELGVEVIELYCEPDGNFPNHHPDPTVLENITDLVAKVRETRADFGIGWDGDADRIGVVDEKGSIIFGDMLLLLYARDMMADVPSPTVIGDVKCSSLLFSDLRKRGAKPVMWKTGHSLIKAKLKELNAELAGEMSGHIFFKHRYYGYDDAIYASVRFVELMSRTDKAASELLNDLPKMVSTPEIRVECQEEIKFKVPEAAKSAFPEYEVDTTDGARVTFPEGWGLVRASNTQPILVLRFEAVSREKLAEYQNLMTSRIDEIKQRLLRTK